MGISTSGGPKGLGTVLDSNTPLSDLTKIIELIARVGNFRGGMTEDARDDITGAALYEGLAVYNTDTEALELYDGAGWVPVWHRRTMAAKARRNAAQSCASGVFTTIAFDTSVYGPSDMWASGDATKIYLPVAGVYQVSATAGFGGALSGRVGVQILKNGVAEFGGSLVPTNGQVHAGAQASTDIRATAGQYLELQVFQDSGSSQNTGNAAYSQPTIAVHYVGV